MIVVDATAILAPLPNTRHATQVAERLFLSGETLHAPHLLDLEVAQVRRRYALAGARRWPRLSPCPLMTRDAALPRAGHRARVEVL